MFLTYRFKRSLWLSIKAHNPNKANQVESTNRNPMMQRFHFFLQAA
jgi:hypothetical protein